MPKKFYAGIGSREIPYPTMNMMVEIAGILDDLGYILRSGGAPGSDTAFEKGAISKEIYLPWAGFNNSRREFVELPKLAFTIAEKFHPKWSALSPKSKLLMARNTMQIFGADFKTRSEFVVCWTPDGCENDQKTTMDTGGTGQAIRIAQAYEIPIFNLKNKDAARRLFTHLEGGIA